MHVLELLLVVAVAAATAVEVQPLLGYHDSVGIPLARQMYELESAAIAKETLDNEKEIPDAPEGTNRFLVYEQDDESNRIVGGVLAPVNAHPYLGGLVISFWNIVGNSACGSTLVSANRLITAAHCWNDGQRQARQFEVVLGSNWLFFGGTRIITETVFMHPAWNPSTLSDDVAVIYLPTNVPISASISPAFLPSGSQLFENFAGQWAMAAGYGMTSDAETGVTQLTQMRQVTVQVISNVACFGVYGSFVRDSNVCTSGAGGVGICGGDSGGPLIINRNGQSLLVGVSSFAASGQCQGGFPSGFARVTSFMSFFNQHL